MWMVKSWAEIEEIEKQRTLVGVFVDRNYSAEKIKWLLDARASFDFHARDAWHLLVPMKGGYGVDVAPSPRNYNVALAAEIIDRLEIEFSYLPCVVFRASKDEHFYLKLGGLTREQFYDEIGRVADVARKCQKDVAVGGGDFGDYVNRSVAVHLRKRKALSAARSALPAISALIGAAVDAKELV